MEPDTYIYSVHKSSPPVNGPYSEPDESNPRVTLNLLFFLEKYKHGSYHYNSEAN
jgi:hypothetical protein